MKIQKNKLKITCANISGRWWIELDEANRDHGVWPGSEINDKKR